MQVIRSDLTARFRRAQAKIRNDLEKLPMNILKGCVKSETRRELGKRADERETLVNLLTTPEMSFHCTRQDVIRSIVRQGFVKPQTNEVRCAKHIWSVRIRFPILCMLYPLTVARVPRPWYL